MSHCNSGGYAGKLVGVYYWLGCSDTTPDAEDYIFAGWRRGTSLSISKESIDVTTAGSASSIREKLQTFTEITGSIDGIAKREDDVKTLRRYIATTPQADCWIKLVIPDMGSTVEIIEIQAMFGSYDMDAPYDESVTNSLDFEAVSVPIFTDVPAFTIVLDPTTVSFASGVGDTVDVSMSDVGVDAAVSVASSSASLTATVDNDTNVITLASSVVGSYTVTVTSLINSAVTATLPVTVTA